MARNVPRGWPTNRSTARASHRELRATPSITERTMSARVVWSDKLWNPPRAVRSSIGERSPASHGVNTRRPLPGCAVLASEVRSSKEVLPAAGRSPSRQSRSHSSALPPDSWLFATSRSPGRIPGTVAIWRTASVFLRGNGQLTQLVVEMATWGWSARTAPEPTQAEWRSGVPAITTTPSGRPRSLATSGSTVAITPAVGRSGGSLDGGTPEAATRALS